MIEISSVTSDDAATLSLKSGGAWQAADMRYIYDYDTRTMMRGTASYTAYIRDDCHARARRLVGLNKRPGMNRIIIDIVIMIDDVYCYDSDGAADADDDDDSARDIYMIMTMHTQHHTMIHDSLRPSARISVRYRDYRIKLSTDSCHRAAAGIIIIIFE